MTKDIPIIYSAPMIRAMIEDRKTETRRLLYTKRKTRNGIIPASAKYLQNYPPPRGRLGPEGFPTDIAVDEYWTLSPWHSAKVGARLWVRESHRLTDCECPEACRGAGHVWYEANQEGYRNVAGNRLRPSIHMPRWASRLTLIVTGTKIERLQDISEADALAEGIRHIGGKFDGCYVVDGTNIMSGVSAVSCFERLWDSLHGSGAWVFDPFIIAISYRVIKANIDSFEAREEKG
jgi:hypothetical protein